MLNHYDVLGVEPTADLETIRHAWRIKVRLLHPDKHQGSPHDVQAEAASETLRATVAWETLRDPEKRRAYDLHLFDAGANGRVNGGARQARPKPGSQSEADMSVTCLLCSTTQRIPITAGRFDCANCDEAWQLAKCEGCDKIAQVRERRTSWRCVSCGRQQSATWGGGARRIFCVRCKAATDVAAGTDRFRCVGCGLEHLRCSCGQYRTFPALPWLTWRCPRCKRINQISQRNSLAVGQFLVLVGAVILVIVGVILFAGMIQ